MKNKTFLMFCVLLLIAVADIWLVEARGGRGRGGGAFGSIFGGWRKSKSKSSSSNGNSRRTISSSPVQYAHPRPQIPSKNSVPKQTHGHSESHSGAGHYPKQQTPIGTGGYHGGYNWGHHGGYNGVGAPQLPPGSTYYANTAAMPPGAIYYAQAPRTSDTGDFLFNMMAGHMLGNAIFGHRSHVTHVYHQNQDAPGSTGRVIIINNGQVVSDGDSDITNTDTTTDINGTPNYWPMDSKVPLATTAASSTVTTNSNTNEPPPHWPMDTIVPLAPFNSAVTPPDAIQPTAGPFFHIEGVGQEQQQHWNEPGTAPAPPSGGIICMPMMFNETSPTDATEIHQVEKIVCFPAPLPPPQTPTLQQQPGIGCSPHKSGDNPQNSSASVVLTDCTTKSVAGDIVESESASTLSSSNFNDSTAITPTATISATTAIEEK